MQFGLRSTVFMVTLPRRLAIVTKLPFSRPLPAAKKKPPTACGLWLLQSSNHFGRWIN
jgi:hypothetical protein